MKRTSMWKKLTQKYRYSFILLRELVITDFKLRYQSSVLGYLWALLKPLFLFAIIYTFFVYIIGIGRGVDHWGPALLLGIVLYSFFQEVVGQGLKSIVKNGGMIRKINFPKYIIVVSTSVSALINLMINLAVVLIFALLNGVELTWGVLLVPVLIIELYAFALGLALILSTLNVKFRDVGYIWDVLSQALFYGSAIMFPLNMVIERSQEAATFLILSPLTQAIQDARHFAVSGTVSTAHTISDNIFILTFPFILTVIVLAAGAVLFRKNAPYFAEDI